MSVNIRKRIGNAIGATAARKGESVERAIARQVKRGGVTEQDKAWMREGYQRAGGAA